MSQTQENALLDKPDSFGWVSILVHWITSITIIVLWFVGRSITEQDSLEAVDARRSLHIAIALTAWLLFLFRIYWRGKMGHPRANGQSLLIHRVARTVHYIMLIAIAIMMISGPIMVWIDNETISGYALKVHAMSASVLFVLVLIHIGGTLKHIVFHEDDTIVRMLWPKK